MAGPHVICVAGSSDRREHLSSVLADGLDVDVVGAAAPDEALAALDDVTTRAVVTVPSFSDADRSGLDLLAAARERAPDVACILYGDPTEVDHPEAGPGSPVQVVDAGANDAPAKLVSRVERAMAGRRSGPYPVPDDESDRLATVQDYPTDDERLRAALDRLADLAAAALDGEYTYVSVLDDRQQHHLATHGFDPGPVDRERSICAYTVAADEVTVIERLDTDPRFAEEAYVQDLDLRWYAGAPVRVDGAVVGTVCLLGSDPFDGVDRDRLRQVGAEAADQFEFAKLRQE